MRNFELIKNWLFLISAVCIAIHQILQKLMFINIPLWDNYGDDFFAMPFMLSLFSYEQRYVWKLLQRSLTGFEIVVFTLIFAIFFEEILPMFNDGFTKDYWDYLAYGLGSLVYYLWEKRSQRV